MHLWITKVKYIIYKVISEYKREKKRRSKIIKTTTTIIKLNLDYSLISEGNTCIAESNLEVLPLTLSSLSTFFNFWKSHTRVANMEYYEKTINNNPNKLYIFEKVIK